jgi:type II secretion system (T2SS) protein G
VRSLAAALSSPADKQPNPAVVVRCVPMDDHLKLQGARRGTCRHCGAVIEATALAIHGLCSACSGRTAGTIGKRTAVSMIGPGQFELRVSNRAPRARAALAELVARGHGPETPIDGEVLSAGKTLISLVVLIPLVGSYLIQRSLVHTAAEKYKLARMSIALAGCVAFWLIMQFPTQATFDARLRTRIEFELNALGNLAEQYRLEHGEFPDVAIWRRLADREDLSFYDAWGRPYRYDRTVDGVTIRTLGRDGVDGGVGMDADLSAHFSGGGS